MHRAQRLAKSVPSDCYEHFRLKKSHYHRRWLNWLGKGINNSFIGNKEADGTRLVLILDCMLALPQASRGVDTLQVLDK
jgi:hypothetical protein